jgi:hypothetical protein
VLGAVAFVVSAISLSAIAPASAALAPRLPEHLRASCFTVLATALTVTQVVLSTSGGALTDSFNPATASMLLLLLPIAAGVTVLVRPAERTVREIAAMPAPAPATADAA